MTRLYAVMVLRDYDRDWPPEGPASEDPARVQVLLYTSYRRALTGLAEAAYGYAENNLEESGALLDVACVRLPAGRRLHRRNAKRVAAAVTEAAAHANGEFWRGWIDLLEVAR